MRKLPNLTISSKIDNPNIISNNTNNNNNANIDHDLHESFLNDQEIDSPLYQITNIQKLADILNIHCHDVSSFNTINIEMLNMPPFEFDEQNSNNNNHNNEMGELKGLDDRWKKLIQQIINPFAPKHKRIIKDVISKKLKIKGNDPKIEKILNCIEIQKTITESKKIQASTMQNHILKNQNFEINKSSKGNVLNFTNSDLLNSIKNERIDERKPKYLLSYRNKNNNPKAIKNLHLIIKPEKNIQRIIEHRSKSEELNHTLLDLDNNIQLSQVPIDVFQPERKKGNSSINTTSYLKAGSTNSARIKSYIPFKSNLKPNSKRNEIYSMAESVIKSQIYSRRKSCCCSECGFLSSLEKKVQDLPSNINFLQFNISDPVVSSSRVLTDDDIIQDNPKNFFTSNNSNLHGVKATKSKDRNDGSNFDESTQVKTSIFSGKKFIPRHNHSNPTEIKNKSNMVNMMIQKSKITIPNRMKSTTAIDQIKNSSSLLKTEIQKTFKSRPAIKLYINGKNYLETKQTIIINDESIIYGINDLLPKDDNLDLNMHKNNSAQIKNSIIIGGNQIQMINPTNFMQSSNNNNIKILNSAPTPTDNIISKMNNSSIYDDDENKSLKNHLESISPIHKANRENRQFFNARSFEENNLDLKMNEYFSSTYRIKDYRSIPEKIKQAQLLKENKEREILQNSLKKRSSLNLKKTVIPYLLNGFSQSKQNTIKTDSGYKYEFASNPISSNNQKALLTTKTLSNLSEARKNSAPNHFEPKILSPKLKQLSINSSLSKLIPRHSIGLFKKIPINNCKKTIRPKFGTTICGEPLPSRFENNPYIKSATHTDLVLPKVIHKSLSPKVLQRKNIE